LAGTGIQGLRDCSDQKKAAWSASAMPDGGIPVIARENYLPVFIGVVISGHTA
jgi:hypothetical protein